MQRSRLDLGVGIIALGAFDHVWAGIADLVDVVEVEPQTLWHGRFGDDRVMDPTALAWLRATGRPLLAHGVGYPVGGTTAPDPGGVAATARSARELGAVHWSEHLAFNVAGGADAGYLLPPVQTEEGVAAAARHVARYRAAYDRPFLVETPTNYLRPVPGDLRDGEYVAAVAEAADCGILLDLHNVWTNERNGRQPVAEYLDDLPLDRVREVHLAGGFETSGFYLDAHVGPVDPRLLALAATVLPRLPNLGAVVYEAVPASIAGQGVAGLRSVLEAVHRVVDHPVADDDPPPPAPRSPRRRAAGTRATADREAELLAFTTRSAADAPAGDPGALLIRALTDEARLSLLVRDHQPELGGLIGALGRERTEDLLLEYLSDVPATGWAGEQGDLFTAWLDERGLRH